MTKIKDIQFFRAISPLSQPIADSTHQIDQIAVIVARLELESGITGDSYLLAFDYSPAAIAGALQDIRSMVRGWDVFRIGAFHQEFARLAEYFGHSGISLAMGEREFDLVPLRELIRREAIDLWQPDIVRLGGLAMWRTSAALAQAHHLPVLPHFYKEYDVPLLMTIPNGLDAECFRWVDPLIDRAIRIEDGYAYPNEEPGWGFRFEDQYLTELDLG